MSTGARAMCIVWHLHRTCKMARPLSVVKPAKFNAMQTASLHEETPAPVRRLSREGHLAMCLLSHAGAQRGGSGRNPSRQRIPRALHLQLATFTLTRLNSTRRKRWTRHHAAIGTEVNSPTQTIGGASVDQLRNCECLDLAVQDAALRGWRGYVALRGWRGRLVLRLA